MERTSGVKKKNIAKPPVQIGPLWRSQRVKPKERMEKSAYLLYDNGVFTVLICQPYCNYKHTAHIKSSYVPLFEVIRIEIFSFHKSSTWFKCYAILDFLPHNTKLYISPLSVFPLPLEPENQCAACTLSNSDVEPGLPYAWGQTWLSQDLVCAVWKYGLNYFV